MGQLAQPIRHPCFGELVADWVKDKAQRLFMGN